MTPVPILLYHEVSATTSDRFAPYSIRPDRFARHADLIADQAAVTCTVSDLVDRLDAGEPVEPGTVVVTVDDGFVDFAEHGWPVLAERSIAATLYVPTGYLGGTSSWLDREGEGDRPVLDADELRRLDREGLEIGAHSHTHPHLDLLDDDAVRHEVTTSGRILEEVLGHRVRSFAYPHGFHDRRVRQAVIDAGFDSACAVKNALSSSEDDRFALARITVRGDTPLDRLERWLQSRDLPVPSPRERVRTRAHRVARRVCRRLLR